MQHFACKLSKKFLPASLPALPLAVCWGAHAPGFMICDLAYAGIPDWQKQKLANLPLFIIDSYREVQFMSNKRFFYHILLCSV